MSSNPHVRVAQHVVETQDFASLHDSPLQRPRARALNADVHKLPETIGIVFILSPAGRIIHNVLADTVKIVLVADNVFVIIALP